MDILGIFSVLWFHFKNFLVRLFSGGKKDLRGHLVEELKKFDSRADK
jgi:hypothetical protein